MRLRGTRKRVARRDDQARPAFALPRTEHPWGVASRVESQNREGAPPNGGLRHPSREATPMGRGARLRLRAWAAKPAHPAGPRVQQKRPGLQLPDLLKLDGWASAVNWTTQPTAQTRSAATVNLNSPGGAQIVNRARGAQSELCNGSVPGNARRRVGCLAGRAGCSFQILLRIHRSGLLVHIGHTDYRSHLFTTSRRGARGALEAPCILYQFQSSFSRITPLSSSCERSQTSISNEPKRGRVQ